MAQKSQEPRSQTHAERRAEQRAKAQARAEQQAKERKQQTIIGVIVIAVVVALLAVAGVAVYRSLHPQASGGESSGTDLTVEQAHEQLKTLDSRPTNADDEGGILISKDGYGKAVENVPTIGIYMDFICPGCGSVNRQLDANLTKLVDAGQINLDLHFMAFMDRFSTDDYSSRAANAILYVSDHDSNPDHLLHAVQNLYAEDFQPQEGSAYVPVSDEQIKEQLTNAGVPEEVAGKAATRNYDDWLNAVFGYTPHQENLQNSEGQMSTPTVTINGYRWDMNSASGGTMFDALLDAIGLKPDQVGVEGDLPSIGAEGKPIAE